MPEQGGAQQHDDNQEGFYFHSAHEPEGKQASILALFHAPVNIKRQRTDNVSFFQRPSGPLTQERDVDITVESAKRKKKQQKYK